MKKYLSMDVGCSKIKYAVIDENLDVQSEGSVYSVLDDEAKLFQTYGEILENCHEEQLDGITVSIPGVIDMQTGFAYSGGVFSWVKQYPYADELKRRFGLPAAVCNDAKAAALAEVGFGSLKKVKNGVLLMLLGTGIGGAVIVDGHLLNGNKFAAGEFSYMMGDYRNRDDKKDTFYQTCSMDALSRLVSDCCGRNMNVFKIMAGLSEKDKNVTAGVTEYCRRLAIFIYNIQCVVDAEKFVLSGTITEEPIIMNMINEAVDQTFASAVLDHIYRPEISGVVFHDNAKLYGAVYHFRQLYEGLE